MRTHIRSLAWLASAGILAALVGCSTRCYVKFRNATSTVVRVESAETGQQEDIGPGRSKQFPHSNGNLVVHTARGETLLYAGISPVTVDPAYHGGTPILPGRGRVVLVVQLQTNMQLLALRPGKSAPDPNQPAGYPKVGVPVRQ